MSGIFGALNTGRVSLSTSQKVIEVIGNNIANVNTPGYSRQSAGLTTYPSLNFNGFNIGQGVQVGSIEREQDVFLTRQIQQKSASLGEASAKEAPLAELERIFTVSDSQLTNRINNFFSSWSNLTRYPGESVERGEVIQQGELLANAFQNASAELAAAEQNINDTLLSKIDGINYRLEQVAELNYRIAAVEATGESANGFRDQRDLLLNELSETIGAQCYEDSGGLVSVQLPGGLPLVKAGNVMPVEGVYDNGELTIQVKVGGTPLNVNTDKLGGEFKGLLEIRDQLIPQTRDQLDQLAYGMITAVNDLHSAGTTLDGATGVDFFQTPASTSADPWQGAATTISVAIDAAKDVAAGASAAPGDNTVASQIAKLADDKVMNGQDTFIGYYGEIASSVGIEAGQNELILQSAQDSMVQLQNMRDSVVGVSLEEEMVDLIQYQKSFDATAKFLSTVDELMDTILTIKR